MKALNSLALLLLLSVTSAVNASVVQYSLTSLGGNSYQYEYTVSNDGSLGGDIEWFALQFDPSLYDETSLTIVTPEPLNSEWDQLILGSGLLIPAAYDVFAVSNGIAQGTSQTGFAVQFAWLGAGLPGSQTFEIYDPVSNDLIDSGTTVVPVPGAFMLFLSALFGMGLFNVKRRIHG